METLRDSEPIRVPKGEHLGCLTWLDASGSAHRWTVKQGSRANNIRVCAKGRMIECGWDRLMRALRKKLATPRRILH